MFKNLKDARLFLRTTNVDTKSHGFRAASASFFPLIFTPSSLASSTFRLAKGKKERQPDKSERRHGGKRDMNYYRAFVHAAAKGCRLTPVCEV